MHVFAGIVLVVFRDSVSEELELELVGEDEERSVGRWNFSSYVKAANAKFQC